MELRTGRLMAMAAGMALPAGVEQVPPELERMAQRKFDSILHSQREPIVNMRSQHPLAKWGRDRIKEKHKAKIAAKSRRRNRK